MDGGSNNKGRGAVGNKSFSARLVAGNRRLSAKISNFGGSTLVPMAQKRSGKQSLLLGLTAIAPPIYSAYKIGIEAGKRNQESPNDFIKMSNEPHRLTNNFKIKKF